MKSFRGKTAIVTGGGSGIGKALATREALRDQGHTDPAVVARDGLKALKRNIVIMPSPANVWPLYLLHRISPAFYNWLGKYFWKKGRAFVLPISPDR